VQRETDAVPTARQSGNSYPTTRPWTLFHPTSLGGPLSLMEGGAARMGERSGAAGVLKDPRKVAQQAASPREVLDAVRLMLRVKRYSIRTAR